MYVCMNTFKQFYIKWYDHRLKFYLESDYFRECVNEIWGRATKIDPRTNN